MDAAKRTRGRTFHPESFDEESNDSDRGGVALMQVWVSNHPGTGL